MINTGDLSRGTPTDELWNTVKIKRVSVMDTNPMNIQQKEKYGNL